MEDAGSDAVGFSKLLVLPVALRCRAARVGPAVQRQSKCLLQACFSLVEFVGEDVEFGLLDQEQRDSHTCSQLSPELEHRGHLVRSVLAYAEPCLGREYMELAEKLPVHEPEFLADRGRLLGRLQRQVDEPSMRCIQVS